MGNFEECKNFCVCVFIGTHVWPMAHSKLNCLGASYHKLLLILDIFIVKKDSLDGAFSNICKWAISTDTVSANENWSIEMVLLT